MQEETSTSPERQLVSKVGKTIHPTQPIETERSEETHPARKLSVHEIYPEAIKEVETNPTAYTADQHFALHKVAREAELAHTPVSKRVKVLYVIGGLLAVSSIFGMIAAIAQQLSAISFVAFVLYAIQLGLGVYLLFSKNISGVELLLKVLLVFQILGTLSSIINPFLFVLRLVTLGVVLYAYNRVNTLSRSW